MFGTPYIIPRLNIAVGNLCFDIFLFIHCSSCHGGILCTKQYIMYFYLYVNVHNFVSKK